MTKLLDASTDPFLLLTGLDSQPGQMEQQRYVRRVVGTRLLVQNPDIWQVRVTDRGTEDPNCEAIVLGAARDGEGLQVYAFWRDRFWEVGDHDCWSVVEALGIRL